MAQGKDPVPPPHWSPADAHVLCLTFFVKIWVCRDLGDLNPRRPLPLYRLIPLTYSVCKLLTLQYTFKICYYILLSVKKNLLCFKDLYYIHSTCVLSEEESVVSFSDQKRQVRCWYCHGKMFFLISCAISSYYIYIRCIFCCNFYAK